MSNSVNPVRVETKGRVAWITIDSPPVNATSQAVRAGLIAAIAEVQGYDLAILSCAGRTFIAGGDMTEFDAAPVAPHLPDVVDAIENSETPILAVLHGTVLGGGFEIAMACAFRVAAPGTRFGLPEVNLGLVPGAGGTQRAPRLLGWEFAVDMACLGKLKTEEELHAVGALDAIMSTDELDPQAFIGRSFVKTSHRSAPQIAAQKWENLRGQVTKHAQGREAPILNFEALEWANEPYEIGQQKERERHLLLRQSAQSRALRHVFFAERSVAKPAQFVGVPVNTLERIVVVGGGLMGSGIAAACLNGAYKVTVIEQNRDAAERAYANVEKLLTAARERGLISQDDWRRRRAALTTTTNYAEAASADLAIEAVFEDLDAKRAVFNALAEVMRSDAILATNTSYLNPEDIFADIPAPQRCFGLHFFSPAHIMKLVEIVKTPNSAPETIATGFDLARRLRKTPVLAGICDGFIGNRILMAYRRAAEYLLADGALPHEIDAAMRAFGMAMGPFEAQDLSGLQIAHANRRRQDTTRDPQERYVTIGDQLVAQGRLGQRAGAGWYSYKEDTRKGERDPAVDAMIREYSQEHGIKRQSYSVQELQTLLLAVMANEGARIVEEGIAQTAEAVDVVKIAGYGFPRWRGGPMHWASEIGHDVVMNALETLEKQSPNSWQRAALYHAQ